MYWKKKKAKGSVPVNAGCARVRSQAKPRRISRPLAQKTLLVIMSRLYERNGRILYPAHDYNFFLLVINVPVPGEHFLLELGRVLVP